MAPHGAPGDSAGVLAPPMPPAAAARGVPGVGERAPLFASASQGDLAAMDAGDALASGGSHGDGDGSVLATFVDALVPRLSDGMASIVDDSFSCCFQSQPYEPWNWNFYLFPLWCVGVVVRHCFLFPIRLLSLLLGMLVFILAFAAAHNLVIDDKRRRALESSLIVFMCSVFVWSWTGVVRFHGAQPSRGAKVFVANHTSMIDFIVLESLFPFAVIMQQHAGWVGFFQTRILNSIGCIYFDRTNAKDRGSVVSRIKQHVHSDGANPLLVFPEGTCVNNEYAVMFKKTAFDLDVPVCPIAIKYNKTFVDAFWNSRRESFTAHLYKLMTSWAVVADVWFLEPMSRAPGESAVDFAGRVQKLIAERAGLKVVPWDGMYKYITPRPETRERQRRAFAERMRGKVGLEEPSGVGAASEGKEA